MMSLSCIKRCDGLSAVRQLSSTIFKSGESNFANSTAKGDDSSTTFVRLFIHLVDAKWRWTWLVFFGTFYISWLIFAIVFWIICFAHGDFDFPL